MPRYLDGVAALSYLNFNEMGGGCRMMSLLPRRWLQLIPADWRCPDAARSFETLAELPCLAGQAVSRRLWTEHWGAKSRLHLKARAGIEWLFCPNQEIHENLIPIVSFHEESGGWGWEQ